MAPIQALESLTRPVAVRVHTDSRYVLDGVTKQLPRWKSNGWQTSAKQPVKNADLWQRLDTAVHRHQVQWHWVKGHAGHPENARADQLAARGLHEACGWRPSHWHLPHRRFAVPQRTRRPGDEVDPAFARIVQSGV